MSKTQTARTATATPVTQLLVGSLPLPPVPPPGDVVVVVDPDVLALVEKTMRDAGEAAQALLDDRSDETIEIANLVEVEGHRLKAEIRRQCKDARGPWFKLSKKIKAKGDELEARIDSALFPVTRELAQERQRREEEARKERERLAEEARQRAALEEKRRQAEAARQAEADRRARESIKSDLLAQSAKAGGTPFHDQHLGIAHELVEAGLCTFGTSGNLVRTEEPEPEPDPYLVPETPTDPALLEVEQVLAPYVAPDRGRSVRVGAGPKIRAHMRDVETLVTHDLAAVPREYLVVDEVKAKKALRAKVEIPGLELVVTQEPR